MSHDLEEDHEQLLGSPLSIGPALLQLVVEVPLPCMTMVVAEVDDEGGEGTTDVVMSRWRLARPDEAKAT
nr:unnamed protein product [Digitaria exilis]